MRSTDAQTHLGRFATRLSENGPSELTDTFLRKQSANFRILQVSTWAWMIPIAALFALYVLGWDRQGRDLLPAGSPVRAGAVAVTAGAMFGFLANDSGPQVIALFVVYLLPFITLLALDHQRGSPILLPPVSPAPGAPERPDIDVVAVPVD